MYVICHIFACCLSFCVVHCVKLFTVVCVECFSCLYKCTFCSCTLFHALTHALTNTHNAHNAHTPVVSPAAQSAVPTTTTSTAPTSSSAQDGSNLPSTYSFDPTSGFYYDSSTGLYYDPKTQVCICIFNRKKMFLPADK